MLLFCQQEVGLRLLEEDDAMLLVKWLSDPAVLEYYEGRDRPHDRQLVQKHFYEDREAITSCIIQYKDQAIGYLQFYPIDDQEKEAYGNEEFQGRIYGMDQFIGETSCWNKGIGSILITQTIDYLTGQLAVNKIVMDPQAWNARALAVYEKAGFVKKKLLEKHEWHEGEYRDCWLVEYDVKHKGE